MNDDEDINTNTPFQVQHPVEVELGSLNHADGSCQWKDGKVSVLVGVFGPMAATSRRDETADGATIKVTVQALQGVPNPLYREHEQAIAAILDQHAVLKAIHPRTTINVVVQLVSFPVSSSGFSPSLSILVASINAVCLALLDAGVALKTTFVAALSVVSRDGVIVPFPKPSHEQNARASFLTVFDASLEDAIESQAIGTFRIEEFLRATSENKKSAQYLHSLIRQSLASSIPISPTIL